MRLLRTVAIAFAVVATIVWGASHVRPLVMRWSQTPQDVWFFDASHGRFRLTNQRVTPSVSSGFTNDAGTLHTITIRDSVGNVMASQRDSMYRDARNRWWFDENAGSHIMYHPTGVISMTIRFICAPIWIFIVLAAMPLLADKMRGAWIRRRRLREGLCIRCGYDLRGTPGRCPECGAITQAGGGAPLAKPS